MSSEPEAVVAFLDGQVHALGQRGQDLLRGHRAAPLLDPAVVVAGDPAQRGDLLAAQPPGTPPGSAGQADVLGLEAFTTSAEEVRELHPIHQANPPSRSGPVSMVRHPRAAGAHVSTDTLDMDPALGRAQGGTHDADTN